MKHREEPKVVAPEDFHTLTSGQRKRLIVTLASGKQMKSTDYLRAVTIECRRITMGGGQKQIMDPDTGREFNHERRVKEAFAIRGIDGVNDYIREVKQRIELLRLDALDKLMEHMEKKKQNTLSEDIFGDDSYKQPINQKQKGNRNERNIAKYLTTWTGKRFIRTPSSGGRRLENNAGFIGDVVAEDVAFVFPFTVETKHYKEVPIMKDKNGVLRNNSGIYTFWKQAVDDAIRAEKTPIMFLRENGMSDAHWYVILPLELAKWASRRGCFELETWGVREDYQIGILKSEKLFKIPFDEFAQHAIN